MKALITFMLAANAIAGSIAALAYLFIPFIHAQKLVDILFIIGLLFWALSSLIRLGDRKIKASEESEMPLEHQSHVFKPDHLATRLLLAGVVPLAGAILLGSILY